jgi:lipopolysaccharide export system permease protein
VVVIAPIALFVGVVYTLYKLNGDSELVVLNAAGVSPGRLMRPFLATILAATLASSVLSLWAMPLSFNEINNLIMEIRADFLTRVVQEGSFATLDEGFVFEYRDRAPDGSLRGIFMQDRRDPQHVSTYLAQSGETATTANQNFLILEKGLIERQSTGNPDPATVTFDRYAIDLTQIGPAADGVPRKPRERSTLELLRLNRNDPYVKKNIGAFRAELNDRFINPLYALVLGMIGFAAQRRAQTTRQGRGAAIAMASVTVLVLRGAGFWASAMTQKHAGALALVYGLPAAGLFGALWCVFGPSWRTLSRLASLPGRMRGRLRPA